MFIERDKPRRGQEVRHAVESFAAELPPGAVAVLAVLWTYQDPHVSPGWARPSAVSLSRATGIHERNVRKHLDRLVEVGAIWRARRDGRRGWALAETGREDPDRAPAPGSDETGREDPDRETKPGARTRTGREDPDRAPAPTDPGACAHPIRAPAPTEEPRRILKNQVNSSGGLAHFPHIEGDQFALIPPEAEPADPVDELWDYANAARRTVSASARDLALTAVRRKAVRSALRAGYTPEQIRAALDSYAAFCRGVGDLRWWKDHTPFSPTKVDKWHCRTPDEAFEAGEFTRKKTEPVRIPHKHREDRQTWTTNTRKTNASD